MILVTGGAGFIGANFILDWLDSGGEPVVNLDKLTYAGNAANLARVSGDARYAFVHGSIGDRARVKALLGRHRPRAIVNFAAETHVDRSIHGPAAFIETNVVDTFALLEETAAWWRELPDADRRAFRFLHVSTDEVYGSLGPGDPAFSEETPYAPNSPYSASKAASDHLVRAWHHTFGLPTLTTNCSNNYGPMQFPEKLIPLMIVNAIAGKPLPVYGDGRNVRDWLYVGDHCAAIRTVLARGTPGATYNVGGNAEMQNIDVVRAICARVGERLGAQGIDRDPATLITHVADRPGHDRRYAIDPARIRGELGWEPSETFASGMRRTVDWYFDNAAWLAEVTSGEYRHWIERHYQAETAR